MEVNNKNIKDKVIYWHNLAFKYILQKSTCKKIQTVEHKVSKYLVVFTYKTSISFNRKLI